MELDVAINGVSMRTPVYIKADAPEQLLLGEGVCRQLQIISYHPSIFNRKGKRREAGSPEDMPVPARSQHTDKRRMETPEDQDESNPSRRARRTLGTLHLL